MTRTTNARIAGFTFLFYIAAGIASMVLKGRAHATDVLSLFTSLSALALGVTFYAQHNSRRARQQPETRSRTGRKTQDHHPRSSAGTGQ
ncbi:MAG TPA: hypothetical protein VN380_17460 [Thermoanaerobaculia bacterium]|jgi:hypothetical protein|nr:hypothetical protein [Thermoanaerobaculia bacterium]